MEKIGNYESMFNDRTSYALSRAKSKLAEMNYKESLDKYQANGGNVMLQFLEDNKPKVNTEQKDRLSKTAKFQALSEALGLIGKGIGAFSGVNPAPSNPAPLLSSMGELRRINDAYDYDTTLWTNQSLRGVLQKNKDDQDMQQFGIDNARQYLNMALGKESSYASSVNKAAEREIDEQTRLQERSWDVEDRDATNKSREMTAAISRNASRGDGGNGKIKVSFIDDTGELVQLSGPDADKLYNDGVKAGVIPADKFDIDKSKSFDWKTLSSEQKNIYYRNAINAIQQHDYDSKVDPVIQGMTDRITSDQGNDYEFNVFLKRPEIRDLRKRGVQDYVLRKAFMEKYINK